MDPKESKDPVSVFKTWVLRQYALYQAKAIGLVQAGGTRPLVQARILSSLVDCYGGSIAWARPLHPWGVPHFNRQDRSVEPRFPQLGVCGGPSG